MTSTRLCFDSDRCERRRPLGCRRGSAGRRPTYLSSLFVVNSSRLNLSINSRTFSDGDRYVNRLSLPPRGRRNPAGLERHAGDAGFKTDFDPSFIEKILTHAARRVPCLADAEVNPRRAWAGLYEMTPTITRSSAPLPTLKGCISSTASAVTA